MCSRANARTSSKGRPSSGSFSSKIAARDPTLPKTGRSKRSARCDATASAVSSPRRRSSSGGRSKVGFRSEEARVGVPGGVGEDVLAREREDLLEGAALLRQLLFEDRRARSDLAEDGPLEEIRAMRRDRVGGQLAETAQLVRREVKGGL